MIYLVLKLENVFWASGLALYQLMRIRQDFLKHERQSLIYQILRTSRRRYLFDNDIQLRDQLEEISISQNFVLDRSSPHRDHAFEHLVVNPDQSRVWRAHVPDDCLAHE